MYTSEVYVQIKRQNFPRNLILPLAPHLPLEPVGGSVSPTGSATS